MTRHTNPDTTRLNSIRKMSVDKRSNSESLSLSGRRILIAGGNGFLGQDFSHFALNLGGEVCWLVRRKVQPLTGVMAFIWSDATDAAWKKESFSDLVIATGTHRHPIGEQEPERVFNANVAVPFPLAGWAAEAGLRHVVYVSSGSV